MGQHSFLLIKDARSTLNQNLSEKSYEYLRERLASGDLPPGTRLVNRTLAEEIGVSVIPVREAISRLASEGLVDHVPGAGSFVRKIDRQNLDNLYVLRDALESCAASEAAKRITEERIEDLEYILDRARRTVESVRGEASGHASKDQWHQWLDDEKQFHEYLIEAADNPLLAKVVADNRAIGSVFEAQRNDPSLLTVEVGEATVRSKAELIEALRTRDADRAKELMSKQIQKGRRTVTAFFRRQRIDSRSS